MDSSDTTSWLNIHGLHVSVNRTHRDSNPVPRTKTKPRHDTNTTTKTKTKMPSTAWLSPFVWGTRAAASVQYMRGPIRGQVIPGHMTGWPMASSQLALLLCSAVFGYACWPGHELSWRKQFWDRAIHQPCRSSKFIFILSVNPDLNYFLS